MRGRGQALAAAALVAVVAVAGTYLQREVGRKPMPAGPPGVAPSGAWFCPHGGGRDWEVTLELANPGSEPVPVRVRDLGAREPTQWTTYTIEPGAELMVPARAEDRGSSSVVEYFEGWVAAGWVAHAGGDEGGVAAEPCSSDAGDRWLLPDNTTTEQQDAYVVVMNPFAARAVFTLTLYSERKVTNTDELTNVTVKPFRSVAFYLNDTVLDETTVSTVVDVKVGRVAAATLGVSGAGGIRSAVGLLGDPPATTVLPGGADQGRTELVVANTTEGRIPLGGSLLQRYGEQALGGLAEANPGGGSALTVPVTTEGPSTIVFDPEVPLMVARRTYGVTSDQGSTGGGPAAASAWLVLPTVAGGPSHAGLMLANPSDEPAVVTLTFLPSGAEPPPAPVTVTVPPHRTVPAPKEWVQARPLAAVLAISSTGTFVPAGVSYSLGREGYAAYAVALGVPIPEGRVP